MIDPAHLEAVAAMVARASPPDRHGSRFRGLHIGLAQYFAAQNLGESAVMACVAHAAECLKDWPAAARVADRRWWMDILDVDPIDDGDSGERFQGWRVPPDWRMHLARHAVVSLYHPKLEGEVLAGLLAHPALTWLQELRITGTIGPHVVEAIISSGKMDHLTLLDIGITGLSRPQMHALNAWRKRTGVSGETKGYKYG